MFKNIGLASVVALSFVAVPALAETPASRPVMTNAATSTQPSGYIARQMEGEQLASNWMSRSVYNNAGDEIGTVSDIVLDAEGKVTAIVIGVGGVMGLGQKQVAVSFASIQETTKDGKAQLMANLSKEDLEKAPSYTKLEDKKG